MDGLGNHICLITLSKRGFQRWKRQPVLTFRNGLSPKKTISHLFSSIQFALLVVRQASSVLPKSIDDCHGLS